MLAYLKIRRDLLIQLFIHDTAIENVFYIVSTLYLNFFRSLAWRCQWHHKWISVLEYGKLLTHDK